MSTARNILTPIAGGPGNPNPHLTEINFASTNAHAVILSGKGISDMEMIQITIVNPAGNELKLEVAAYQLEVLLKPSAPTERYMDWIPALDRKSK